jgi:N-succinyldiaminopimelate aminotransferase
VTALAEVGFRFTVPEGAYYVFVDYQAVPALHGKSPMEAAVFLIEGAGIAAVPGDGFYASPGLGATHMRFAFCRSLATLEEAARRLTKLA